VIRGGESAGNVEELELAERLDGAPG